MNSLELLEKHENNDIKIKKLGLDENSIIENKKLISNINEEEANKKGNDLVRMLNKNYKEDSTEYDNVCSLIKNGANLNIINSSNSSALIQCSRHGFFKTFITLLKFGAYININNGYKTNCLMAACRHGHYEIAEICIILGIDVNAQCLDGDTALMMAKRHGNKKCYDLLVKNGAILNIKNNKNETVFDIKTKDGEIIEDDNLVSKNEKLGQQFVSEEECKEVILELKEKLNNLGLLKHSGSKEKQKVIK